MRKFVGVLGSLLILTACGGPDVPYSGQIECKLHLNKVAGFSYSDIKPGLGIEKFSIYQSEYYNYDPLHQFEYHHLAGDSLVNQFNRSQAFAYDSATGRIPFWDSLANYGVFFNIEPRYWGPGQDPILSVLICSMLSSKRATLKSL